jgi:predicted N-acetyltransferase YhbS
LAASFAPAASSSVAAPGLRPEAVLDAAAIERVLGRAFGPGRFTKPSEYVRAFARHVPHLSRVAIDANGALIGCCRLYEISVGAAPALFLGPLAVDPAAQHGGLGHRLVLDALDAGREAGWRAVVLMGDPNFFHPIGFAQIPEGRVRMPVPAAPKRLHWIALQPGALETLEGPISPPLAASPA